MFTFFLDKDHNLIYHLNMNNLKEVDLSEIDLKNAFFHFTDTANLDSIAERGLLPSIGENSRGVEKRSKSFFAMGNVGALEICNVWIKWLIYMKQRITYLKKAQSPQETDELKNQFDSDFLSGKIYTEESKIDAFNRFYKIMSTKSYLILELEENVDYSLSDFDDVKKYCAKQEITHALYGQTENINNDKMERWNMHTIEGVVIPPEKIKLLHDQNSYSAYDIIKSLYQRTKTDDVKLDFLVEFFKYAKELEVCATEEL